VGAESVFIGLSRLPLESGGERTRNKPFVHSGRPVFSLVVKHGMLEICATADCSILNTFGDSLFVSLLLWLPGNLGSHAIRGRAQAFETNDRPPEPLS